MDQAKMVNEDQQAANLHNDAVAGIRPPKSLTILSDKQANWKQWIQQFEWYATAIQLDKKPENVQAATFMSVIGPEAIDIFNSFNLSDAEKGKISTIKEKFKNYFEPKRNVSYERFIFFKIVQKDDEPFDEFLTRIKTQASSCEFGTLQDEMLKDKIVFGVKSSQVREKLLTEDNLTLTKAAQICQASEQATKQLDEIENKANKIMTFKSQNKDKHSKEQTENSEKYDCSRCGTSHKRRACPAFNQKCNKCKRIGHFSKMCRSKQDNSKQKSKKVVATIQHNSDSEDDEDFFIFSLNTKCDEEDWMEVIKIAGKQFLIKLDTGAGCNVLPKHLLEKVNGKIKETRTKHIISYTNDKISVLGQATLQCKISGKTTLITFKIVQEQVLPVLSGKTCKELGLIARVETIQKQLEENGIFDGLGCVKNYEYDIDLIENPQFKIHPPRKVPHAIRNEVKKELDRMVQLGVIEPVKEPTPAVSPMVVVRRSKKIRICLDPSDVNKNILRRHFPLNTLEEIAADIKGSKYFTLLDCRKGFWHIKVSERTQKYLVFSTPWGRYKCKRLPFGLSSAPEVFQEFMISLLKGVKNVKVAIDDILLYAKTLEELREITSQVIGLLDKAGFKLNKEKCIFEAKRLKVLGHIVSANGLEADPEKVAAIQALRAPTNKQELQRLLGMLTYLNKFIPNAAELTDPIRELLHKDVAFIWESIHDETFKKIKSVLSSTPVLKLYDVNEPVTLSVDASSRNLGVALLQGGQPVAYGARALSKSEQNYPQIEKEALAIKFGCKKFHEYVYGKQLTIESDHKPLEAIFKKNIQSAPARLRRIMFEIMPYSPKILYIKGSQIPLADILSRDCDTADFESEEELHVMMILPISQQAKSDLIHATIDDPECQMLINAIIQGFPERADQLPLEIRHYFNFKEELAYYEGIIFKGDKICVPKSLIPRMLKNIHTGHLGVQSCVKRARQALYWKNQYNDIVNMVTNCAVCEQTQKSNVKDKVLIKEVPSLPWQFVASDIFELKGDSYLVICDSYSGFVDFQKLKNLSSYEIILHFKRWFATHGIPQKLETDCGTQYTSTEFQNFRKEWNFEHTTSSPYHHQGNGLAERAVQVVKNILRKCSLDGTDPHLALLNWRNTPRNEKLGSANERLFGRITRSLLPVTEAKLKPKIITDVPEELHRLRTMQTDYSNKHTKEPEHFDVNDKVRLKVGHRQWKGAKVIEKPDGLPRSVIVQTDQGKVFRRNISDIHKTQATIPVRDNVVVPTNLKPTTQEPQNTPPSSSPQPISLTPKTDSSTTTPATTTQQHITPTQILYKTKSGRPVKPVVKLNL